MSTNSTSSILFTLIPSLHSLAPFWSSGITKFFFLGNEYNMVFSILINEIINRMTLYISDMILILLIISCSVLFILHKLGISAFKYTKFTNKKKILLFGYEETSNNVFSVLYPDTMLAIIFLVIDKYKFTNYIQYNDKIILDNICEYKLENDLYFSVIRSTTEPIKVTYELSSYKLDIKSIIQNAVQNYIKYNKQYTLTLYGEEVGNISFKYPKSMSAVTYVLIKEYDMKNLKLINESTETTKKENQNDEKKEQYDNENCSDDNNNTQNKNITFLVDNCTNFKLNNDIYITITRYCNIVKYTLQSDKDILKDFIIYCNTKYDARISDSLPKYSLVLVGDESTFGSKMYPVKLNALIHKLITKKNIMTDLKYTGNHSYGETEYTYDGNLNISFDDIQLKIEKTNIEYDGRPKTVLSYKLSSNIVNLVEYIEQCMAEYRDYLNSQKKQLFHFRYNGIIGRDGFGGRDGILDFTQTVLCETIPDNLENIFDTIHNEHVERFKADILKLKDDEYWTRTGLKRKIAYLAYGEPGCGKNALIEKCAIYDKRHIIDIPFSKLKTNSELVRILNLKQINNVEFTKWNIVIMFDEINYGIKKLFDVENVSLTDKLLDSITAASYKSSDKNYEKPQDDKLSIDIILSTIDGIGNYDGLILYAQTNKIDELPKALYRDLRLTPVFFTYLRKCDVINILKRLYKQDLDESLTSKIEDRKISPAKLLALYNRYNYLNVDDFINIISETVTNDDRLENTVLSY